MPDIKSWLYFNRSISLGHAGLHCGSHRRVYIAYVDLTTGYIVFSPIEGGGPGESGNGMFRSGIRCRVRSKKRTDLIYSWLKEDTLTIQN